MRQIIQLHEHSLARAIRVGNTEETVASLHPMPYLLLLFFLFYVVHFVFVCCCKFAFFLVGERYHTVLPIAFLVDLMDQREVVVGAVALGCCRRRFNRELLLGPLPRGRIELSNAVHLFVRVHVPLICLIFCVHLLYLEVGLAHNHRALSQLFINIFLLILLLTLQFLFFFDFVIVHDWLGIVARTT